MKWVFWMAAGFIVYAYLGGLYPVLFLHLILLPLMHWIMK